jgi:hypothetical protein
MANAGYRGRIVMLLGQAKAALARDDLDDPR